jgi:hypothetical protein
MSRHGLIALVVALVFALSPVAGRAADKQIADVKELAGTWQGWVNSQLAGSERVLMTIKADGSYQSSTSRDGGTLTVGKYYLDGGKLKYRSSRTEGTAVVSEDKGKTTLTLKPEGSYNQDTGPAVYERMK